METPATSASPVSSPPGLPLSALQTLLHSSSPPTGISPHLYALAQQVLHNLQHQHDWSCLRIHTHSPSSGTNSSPIALPRPLVSGLPPQRIYVHPDEQVEMLKRGIAESDVEVKREWVLPTHLREKWTLKGFAGVFDGLEKGELEENGGADGNGRGVKRILLAVVGDDSTIVYYIMHDGIVKPRQN